MSRKKQARKIKETKVFTESARKAIVKELENGMVKAEACRKYSVSYGTLYNWLNKYSTKFQTKPKIIVESKKEADSYKALQDELKQAYELLGRSQMEVMFLQQLLEHASDELKIDIKKNFGTNPFSGLKNTKKRK